MHVTSSAWHVTKVGDSFRMRLTHVHEAVLCRVKQILCGAVHGSREQPDRVEAVRTRGGRREDERTYERAVARAQLGRGVATQQCRRLVQVEQLRIGGRAHIVVLSDGVIEPPLAHTVLRMYVDEQTLSQPSPSKMSMPIMNFEAPSMVIENLDLSRE